MSNYDHDVLGVGNFEHPANQSETEGIDFHQAMDSLTDEQREAIEGEFIDRNAQVERYAKKLDKAKELMQVYYLIFLIVPAGIMVPLLFA